MLHDFYGKQGDDIFEERQVTSLSIIACTADMLAAEYNGYKTYVARQTIKQNNILKKRKEILKLGYYKPVQIETKNDMKPIKAEISETYKGVSFHPMTFFETPPHQNQCPSSEKQPPY